MPRRPSRNQGGNGTNGGKWAKPLKRLMIHLRDGFICVYCLRDLRGAKRGLVTLDHVRPRSDGGTNDPANLITACLSCNARRQDRPIREFSDPETIARIRRHVRRKIGRYRVLARSLLASNPDEHDGRPRASTDDRAKCLPISGGAIDEPKRIGE